MSEICFPIKARTCPPLLLYKPELQQGCLHVSGVFEQKLSGKGGRDDQKMATTIAPPV